MKVLIKHFKESGLDPETMLRTQRSRLFPKPEKWLIFGILSKGGSHETFLESLATVTSLKNTWNEGPDEAPQGKRLSSRNYAAYDT